MEHGFHIEEKHCWNSTEKLLILGHENKYEKKKKGTAASKINIHNQHSSLLKNSFIPNRYYHPNALHHYNFGGIALSQTLEKGKQQQSQIR